MKIHRLFLEFIQKTRPNFWQFSGPDRCMYLTGGMAIKIFTKEYRKPIGRKLPSTDFDFTWAFSRRPTISNYNQMTRFTKSIGKEFAEYLGNGAKVLFTKKKFTPVLQNARTQRYIHAHCNVTIQLGGEDYDLMDSVLVHLPGVSDEFLSKRVSHKYNVPIPKIRIMYTDTASVVKKTLMGTGYNAWRNPIKSTHPKHPEEYQKKGLKNINRLLLMQNIIKSNKNLPKNILALNRIIKSNLATRQKLAIGRAIGTQMNKNIQLY